MLDAGDAREVAIKTERMTTVIRLINEEYFVAIAIKPSGNVGKARFLLRTRSSMRSWATAAQRHGLPAS